MPFLSGGHICVRMFYTLPQAIKEEKEDEERVGILDSKRERVEKAESEETREEVQRGFFLFFIFCLRHCRERRV